MKKNLVLIILFVLPLVVYMFFASGVTQFGKLPVLSGPIPELNLSDSRVQFQDKITILGFLGKDAESKMGNVFNLNQKIYKPFFEFHDFQVIIIVPEGAESAVEQIKKELSGFTDIRNWHFVYASDMDIKSIFNSLQTDLVLDATLGSPYVFIVDKDRMLRGRTNDEDVGTKFGFNATSVADLNNKMKDDVKIILAEYRLALKKNQAVR
jgi:hypothetical protein